MAVLVRIKTCNCLYVFISNKLFSFKDISYAWGKNSNFWMFWWITLFIWFISHDPGSHDPDPGPQEKSMKKSCVSVETECRRPSTCVMNSPKDDCHPWKIYIKCPEMNFMMSGAFIKAVKTIQGSVQILPHVRKTFNQQISSKVSSGIINDIESNQLWRELNGERFIQTTSLTGLR